MELIVTMSKEDKSNKNIAARTQNPRKAHCSQAHSRVVQSSAVRTTVLRIKRSTHRLMRSWGAGAGALAFYINMNLAVARIGANSSALAVRLYSCGSRRPIGAPVNVFQHRFLAVLYLETACAGVCRAALGRMELKHSAVGNLFRSRRL